MKWEKEESRIPLESGGIQINFCKNPKCSNYGVPASIHEQPRGPGAGSRGSDSYKVQGTKGRHTSPTLLCSHCNEGFPIKSNLAIAQESGRMLRYLKKRSITCPNSLCENHMVDVQTDKSQYYSFGKTKSGSQRYRCRLCKKTFSVGSPTLRQRKPHKNIQIFRLLVNKMPFKRICEVADVSMPTLYDKIEFIHRQCLSFVASRERKLLEGMPIRRLYLCVDRQDYLVNWTQREDKRNVQLSSVGCADNTTGYVFGLHPNFDPEQEWSTVEADAVKSGDYDMRYPFRKYPRLWLQGDYNDAMNRAYSKTYRFRADSLDKEIESTYEEVAERDDVEVPEMLDENTQLPSRGMLVHSEYALYGHFFFLKKLLSGVEKVRFFLDQESGIRAACLSAFVDEIKQQRCDAFYVRINKDLTVDQRKRVLAENRKEWAVLKREHPDLSDSALKLMIIKERMKKVRAIGKWQDRWVYHPFPNMSEPEKAVCYLTDNGQYDEDHIAWLYNKASLHAIDRFFMQVRRRISLLERPISTSSNPGRKWHGYSPYDPGMVIKLLDIFRVFYNYVEIGKDKETPASRLGLAKGKVDMEDILYFGG